MTTIIGLDLSLTGAARCVVDTDDVLDVRLETFTSKPADTLHARRRRLSKLCGELTDDLTYLHRAHAVIEQPSYGSKGGHTHDRSGLWWLVVDTLREAGIPVTEIPPSTLKKYATGNGGAGVDKVVVSMAAARRFPHLEIANDNEADALWLAAAGMRHHDRPLEESLPKVNVDALAAVRWSA